VAHIYNISALGRQRQEDREFKASLETTSTASFIISTATCKKTVPSM
jgi:hypothetical protein